jgi:hypothetical protein
MFVLIFSTAFVWNISHSKRARYHKCTYVIMWSTNYSCQIFMKFEFNRQILRKKNIQRSNFKKILAVGTEFYRSNGRTDIAKLIVAFRNFATAPKMFKKKCRRLWRNENKTFIRLFFYEYTAGRHYYGENVRWEKIFTHYTRLKTPKSVNSNFKISVLEGTSVYLT